MLFGDSDSFAGHTPGEFGTGAGWNRGRIGASPLPMSCPAGWCCAGRTCRRPPRSLTPEYATLSPSQRELNAVVGQIRSGTIDNRKAWQALQVSRIVEALYRSAKTGQGVPL